MKKFLDGSGNGSYGAGDAPMNYLRGSGGGGWHESPVMVMENTAAHVDTEDARMEAVTECNSCSYYNRGECGRSGLAMTPDDYCSKAVPAEA